MHANFFASKNSGWRPASWSASMRLALCLVVLMLAASVLTLRSPSASTLVSVTTYHNDNTRQGLNANETILTPANVNPAPFGKLFSHPLDGLTYAQPLYLPGVRYSTSRLRSPWICSTSPRPASRRR
jgi:hypothetical protein